MIHKALLTLLFLTATVPPAAAADISDIDVTIERLRQEPPWVFVVVRVTNNSAKHLSFVSVQ